jgi:rubrerythrin
MSKTDENMAAAFAGESQANRKYLAFAKVADKEGQPQVAKLFRAAAEAETIHALGHFKAMGGIGDTKANLDAAVEGETYEFTKMYPVFIVDAEKEGREDALKMFRWANAVEEVHAALYNKYRDAVRAGKPLETKPIFICTACGYTVEGDAPDKCPVCKAAKKGFTEIK